MKTTLHSFAGGNTDGSHPAGGLVLDKHGNLYGATSNGGPGDNGVIYKLSPPTSSGGEWAETVLYIFPADGSGGAYPNGDLVLDADDNVYGTTSYGGSSCNCGLAFELSPPAASGNPWTVSLIHVFTAIPSEGAYPSSGLTFDKSGALYGVTYADFLPDGEYDPGGTVFELKRHNGVWTRKIIFDFGTDPALFDPGTPLVVDKDGNLWGTTYDGGWDYYLPYVPPCYMPNGSTGCGGVFELKRPSTPNGNWSFTMIYPFIGPYYGFKQGLMPQGRILLDSAGNVYGNTWAGGINGKKSPGFYAGTIFQLQPPTQSGNGWTLSTMYAFAGSPNDGKNPTENMVLIKGVFYGTTSGGGSTACDYGCGTVFRFVVTP